MARARRGDGAGGSSVAHSCRMFAGGSSSRETRGQRTHRATPGDDSAWRAWRQDLRHAVRSLRATPTFTIVALVVLTLGIGATTAIFSVVDGVALRGVPFPRGNRLVIVTEPRLSGRGATTVAPPDFEEWRREQTTFEGLAASQGSRDFVWRDHGANETLRASLVTASLFRVLRASPAIGRSLHGPGRGSRQRACGRPERRVLAASIRRGSARDWPNHDVRDAATG